MTDREVVEAWRQHLLRCWANGSQATMTALLEDGPQYATINEGCKHEVYAPDDCHECETEQRIKKSGALWIFVEAAKEIVATEGRADWVDIKNLLRVIYQFKKEAVRFDPVADGPEIRILNS